MMFTPLISGSKQPGNDIDVYPEPLIKDLKRIWKGEEQTYDAYRNEYFTLKGILLWTISDFPAYENLSGHSVKGYYACPICGEGTCSLRLKCGAKNIYHRNRRFYLKTILLETRI